MSVQRRDAVVTSNGGTPSLHSTAGRRRYIQRRDAVVTLTPSLLIRKPFTRFDERFAGRLQRAVFEAEIAFEACFVDLAAEERIVLFAVFHFVAAGDARRMEMADDVQIRENLLRDIAFHDARVVDVVEAFDVR